MTITEFIGARLDEREVDARRRLDEMWRAETAREFRQVIALRAAVAEALRYEAKIDGEWGCCHSPEAIAAGNCPDIRPEQIPVLAAIAAIDSDHQDYRIRQWAPEGAQR